MVGIWKIVGGIMIRRFYAYSAITQTDNPKFSCGIASTKSWLPEPLTAFQSVLDGAMSASGCPKNQVRVEYFARV